ncbi:MAG: hypothetical protein EA426_18505 [Spirochaetaceae bacterium]|nr:MAG: hypothetical protein EA426_18505 [Spirochaetaceae bacterium]
MFFLRKLVTQLFMPLPLALILLAAAGVCFFVVRKRTRAIAVLVAAAGMVIFLSSSPLVAEALIRPLERAHPALFTCPAEGPDPYIVVLGSGRRDDGSVHPLARLSDAGTARLAEGFRIFSGLPEAVLVFSGGALGGETTIADAMADAAVSLGVPDGRIVRLSEPVDTASEAATFASAVASDARPRGVILVTSASHMPRALYLFRLNGIEAIPAPTDYRALRRSFSVYSLFPDAASIRTTERAVHEYLGLLWTYVRFGRSAR